MMKSGVEKMFVFQSRLYELTKLERKWTTFNVALNALFFYVLNFFSSQHMIGYQSFEASRKMTRYQKSLSWHGFDTTSI
jgi:hypothetical protein